MKREEELRQYQEETRKKQDRIDQLQKERDHNQKEIRERDKMIGDKEQRIYDLKKQNQDLEKFKFVLDYKIKDLNRQIEPRENEITDMKDNITEMDHELEQYHKMNAALDKMIGENREKLDSIQRQIMQQRQRISDQESRSNSFCSELHSVAQHIQDPEMLKEAVKRLHSRYVLKKVKTGDLDADITKEYKRQKEYLEKSVDALKRRLNRDSALHRADNMRVMQNNMALVKEINKLRPQVRAIRLQAKETSDSGKTQAGHRGSDKRRRGRTGTASTGRASTAASDSYTC